MPSSVAPTNQTAMRYASLVAAFFLWLLFLYVSFVAVVLHLLPHFVSSELNERLVLFLVADALILQFLAWAYKKLPTKPQSAAFTWLERVSIL